MILLNKLKLILLFSCIFRLLNADQVVQFNQHVFVKHPAIKVNVFEEEEAVSKVFVLNGTSFSIPIPDLFKDINDTVLLKKSMDYVNPKILDANSYIYKNYGTICYSNREKRFDPVTLIGLGAVFIITLIFFVTNSSAISDLKRQHEEAMEQIQVLTQYFNETIFDDSYSYNLKLIKCSSKNVEVQITAVKKKLDHIFFCNQFNHLGYFNNSMFYQYDLKNYYCYNKINCFSFAANDCIQGPGVYNCTSKMIDRCLCSPDQVSSCNVNVRHAPQNFLQYSVTGSLITIQTRAPTYTLITSNSAITKTTPPSGIFSLLLNENEKIKIGGIIIHGTSSHATFVAHVLNDSFVAPSPPTINDINFHVNKVQNGEYNFHILLFVTVLLVLIGVYFLLKKHCC